MANIVRGGAVEDIRPPLRNLKIAVGTDSFKAMVSEHDVYVDKTPFIAKIIDSDEKAILITYPRRWGKSLNLDMLRSFFEPETDKCKNTIQHEVVVGATAIALNKNLNPIELKSKFEALSALLGDFEVKNNSFIKAQERCTEAEEHKNLSQRELNEQESKLYLLESYIPLSWEFLQRKEYKLYSRLMDDRNNKAELHRLAKHDLDLAEQDKSVAEQKLKAIGALPSPCNRIMFKGGIYIGEDYVIKELKPLKISTNAFGNYMNFQGKYPVIFISLKDITGSSLEEIKDKFKTIIKSLYREYRYLENSSKLAIDEKVDFKKYIESNYTGITIEESIKFLSELLHKHHNQRVYVLVDEYDKPVNSFLENYLGHGKTPEKESLVKDVTKLISDTVCSPIAKTNSNIEKLILVGIFDTTSKEFGSGCNNTKIFGISDQNFSKYFGFSYEEVEELVKKFSFKNPKEILDRIKDWYDGYNVPVSLEDYMSVYTPWAVMNYLNDINKKGEGCLPQNYWSKSGASSILRALFNQDKCLPNSKINGKFLTISMEGEYELKFDNQISLFKYNWFTDSDNEEFFSYLLLNAGYLTTVQQINGFYKFSIPNRELLEEFSDIIPRDKKICEDILNNLKKTSQLRIIKLIQDGNPDDLQSALSEPYINYMDKSMNFNLFHLAAIFGNGTTFEVLSNAPIERDVSLAFTNDRKSGFKPLDYAFLLKNDDFISKMTKAYKGESSEMAKTPWWGSSIICFAYHNTITSGTTSGSLDFAKDMALDQLGAVRSLARLSFYILSAVATSLGTSSIEKLCNQYGEYHSIDTSDPAKFGSLKQFVKYLLEHEQAEVVVNNECNEIAPIKLKTLAFGIFENSFYSEEEIVFTLCSKAYDM